MDNNIKTVQQDNNEIDLLELFTTLLDGKWTIVFFTTIACGLALIIAYGQPSIYASDTLLQVEKKTSTVPGLEGLAGLSGAESSIPTELELLRSRNILGQVVKKLKLDIVANPQRIKRLGLFYHHFFNKGSVEKPPQIWGQWDDFASQYAWGNESIEVVSLVVPDSFLNKALLVIAGEKGSYKVFDGDILLMKGKIDKLSFSKNNQFEIHISKLIGLPGTHYSLVKQSPLASIKNLQDTLKITEKGKKTGVIQLQLNGTDKAKMIAILNNIAYVYLELNKSYSKEEAGKALVFLENQLGPIKKTLAEAELALSQYRTRHQTANMSVETTGVLGVVAGIDTQLQELALKKAELSQQYTVHHPRLKVLVIQESKLKQRKKEMLSQVTRLPKKQQDLLELERDRKVSNEIYFKILNDIQEFKIAKESKMGNVHVVDKAVAYEGAVKPKRSLIVAIGGMLGLLLGVAFVFVRKMLHRMITDPNVLEQKLNIPVYATIPLHRKLNKLIAKGKRGRIQKTLLALQDPTDPTIESLRSLRTSLQFTLFEADNNVLMITGPSPSVGKSFISSNFAAVLANSGQKILLIDADMRKGYLHKVLDLPSSTLGLSDLISGECSVEEAVHSIPLGEHSIDAITCGRTPPNPSELLMNTYFAELLVSFSKKYDLVLIDTPPVNAVTDPVVIGRHAGVVFMVVHNNHHPIEEIEHSLATLKHSGVTVNGFIYNGYVASKHKYGYGSYEYGVYK